jgi:hypothetical protein
VLNCEVICLVQESLVDVDISKYLVSRRELPKRELVVFECLLSEACSVVAVLLKDSAYRSLNVKSMGYNAEHLPLVSIEVEFAVLV